MQEPTEPLREPTKFDKAPAYSRGMKFEEMTGMQKVIFVSKVVVCVATFGFVFPNVQSS